MPCRLYAAAFDPMAQSDDSFSWIIRGFTGEFALELLEIRKLFELRSAQAFAH